MYNIYYALHCNGTGGGDAYLGIKVGKVKGIIHFHSLNGRMGKISCNFLLIFNDLY